MCIKFCLLRQCGVLDRGLEKSLIRCNTNSCTTSLSSGSRVSKLGLKKSLIKCNSIIDLLSAQSMQSLGHGSWKITCQVEQLHNFSLLRQYWILNVGLGKSVIQSNMVIALDIFSSQCDILSWQKWFTDNHCNWSDTQPSILLLELY